MGPARAPSASISLRERFGALDPLRRVLLGCALALLLAALVLPAILAQPPTITTYFFAGDVACLLGIAVVLGFSAVATPSVRLGSWARFERAPSRSVAVVAVLLAAVALAGTWGIHHGIGLSYDEVMAEFDARIFLGGGLIAPLAPDWRHSVSALAPNFVLPVPGDAAWASSYLPVNAALRAAFAMVGTPALTGPVLAAVAVLAVAGIARRLWPDRPDAALVASLMLATSPQVVFTAMTPYAMTAHLALNLVWLWLFLRGGALGHGGAIAVGFLACGLHQLIFHPLFAAPFLFGLVVARRWRLSALYLVAYALIGTFWTLYWQGVLLASGYSGTGAGTAVGVGYTAAKLAALLRDFDWRGLDVMAMNLVRFVAWQSPVLLPLAVAAVPAIRRGAPSARPLFGGIALTAVAMFVLLPFQGHGWGYRYLHGLIGSACLLAAQGWVDLSRAMDERTRAAAAAILGLGWLGACAILIPGRGVEVERFVAPYAGALAAIADDPAETILIDAHALVYGADLVRNDPYLRGGRAVLTLQGLDPAKLADLCARGTVALFGAAEGARFGIARPDATPAALPPSCPVRPVRLP